jgi:tetratricopeptide (TPR) repeat protein
MLVAMNNGASMLLRALAVVLDALLGAATALGQAPVPPSPSTISPELRGDIFMAKRQYREAIEAFRQGSPKDPALQNKIGIAFHQQSQLDDALKSYQRAVRLKPDYAEAINNIGTVYYVRKSYRRAISYFRRAIKIAPEDPRSASFYANLGQALWSRKQRKETMEALQKAFSLDPEVFEHRSSVGTAVQESTVAERAEYRYFQAKIYAQSGRTDLALQYLRKAFEEGFKDKKQVEKDKDFDAMRDLQEFKDLMAVEQRVL